MQPIQPDPKTEPKDPQKWAVERESDPGRETHGCDSWNAENCACGGYCSCHYTQAVS